MANRVTDKDKIEFNRLYYKYKNYSEVARQTGFSPSTVKKYIINDYVPIDEDNFIRIITDDINPTFDIFIGVDNFGDLCVLSEEEEEEIKVLWNELEI